MPTERYDAAVAGGGLTGLVAAASLARAGFEVVVVEGRERGAEGDGRVSALTVASERILRRLGAWERITGAASFRRMRVWEASGGAEIRFDARAVGAEHLGHIVENRVIAEALEEVVESLGVAWSRPSRVAGLELGRGEVTVELGRSPGRAEGRARVRSRIRSRVRAGLLVGADGGDSVVRSLAGIPARGRDYRQLGIVCSVRPERHHRDTAWQVARPAGPLAFLPLPEGLCSIVWSTARGHAEHLLALADDAFRRELETAFEGRLGAIEWAGPRAGFPLRAIRAATYSAPRVALAGDAAHTIHPLAGQGVNLGILDAAYWPKWPRRRRRADATWAGGRPSFATSEGARPTTLPSTSRWTASTASTGRGAGRCGRCATRASPPPTASPRSSDASSSTLRGSPATSRPPRSSSLARRGGHPRPPAPHDAACTPGANGSSLLVRRLHGTNDRSIHPPRATRPDGSVCGRHPRRVR